MMKTELISYLFLSYLALLVSSTPQFTTCPSSVCLSQPVTYECNSGDDGLAWIVLDTTGDRVDDPVTYNEFNSVGNTGSIGGQFDTVLTVGGSSLVSNITFTPTLSMNNYIVQCGGAGTLVNCSIVIAGIPTLATSGAVSYGAPISTYMRFSWATSMSPCLSHYVLVARSTSSMDDINYYNVSASSSTYTYLDLPLSSTNNTLYNFSVLTVDTGGRSSESIIRQIIFNVPGYVANLMLTQTDYPTDINDTVNITVSWNPPPDLAPIPDPLFYNIIYNVSGVPQNTTIPQYISSRTLSGFTVGSEYTVGVAAINPLGTGPTTSATITILATPPPPVIPSTSTVHFTSYFSSGISAAPTMTLSSSMSPSSSITPSNTPTQEPSRLSAGAIAGIVIVIIGLALAVSVILVIAIVCYVKKKNKDIKPSVAPQMIEAYNYTQVDYSAKSSSSTIQAPPKPAKAISPEADNQVLYSAIQKSAASDNPPPPEGTEYADLDHSSLSSGRRHQRPKDTSNQVTYSHVSHHHDRRRVRGSNHGNYY